MDTPTPTRTRPFKLHNPNLDFVHKHAFCFETRDIAGSTMLFVLHDN